MITVYELICPITQGVVYVGMTGNIKERYFQHVWGSNSDSKDKAVWRDDLKQKGLTPLLIIVGEYETRKESKKNERLQIVRRLNEGCELFNIADSVLYYQYTTDGELVNVYHTMREAKKDCGIMPKMNGLTSGGFVWTHGEFDKSKLDVLNESRSVNCKEVMQLTKGGELVNTFKGVREACRQTGIDHRSISQIAGGSKTRKSAGGFLWKYT